MPTITVPTLPDGSGPDLSSLAGVEPLRYSRDPGGQTYTVTMPPGWTPPGRLDPADWISRFTPQEVADIEDSDDVQVRYFRKLSDAATYVNVNDPRTIAGIQYLEAVGLLAPGRAAEILDPEAP